jgi:replicative DNA helicase
MYDLSVLKSFLKRDNYEKYRNYVGSKDLPKEIQPILRGIDEWYKENTEEPTIEDVANLTFSAGVSEKDREYVTQVFHTLPKINGDGSVNKLLERFRKAKIANDIALYAVDAIEGRKDFDEIAILADKLKDAEVKEEIEYVTDDLEDILNSTKRLPGLRWRLDSLNKRLGSLRKGDFGTVFSRPEGGKTTFLASEVTFMAGQLKENDGPILWLNNEEAGKKVKLRCYQAALQASLPRLLQDPTRAQNLYRQRTNSKIKLFDDATFHRRKIEVICAQEKPSLIVFDQLDKIKGFAADREDLVMGAMYQWARELAKTYCPVIAICQANGEAEGEAKLNMAHMANAKTSKQAEADWILGIGRKDETGYELNRYFNLCKNKLTGDEDTNPALRHSFWEVIIRPDVSRYEDLP